MWFQVVQLWALDLGAGGRSPTNSMQHGRVWRSTGTHRGAGAGGREHCRSASLSLGSFPTLSLYPIHCIHLEYRAPLPTPGPRANPPKLRIRSTSTSLCTELFPASATRSAAEAGGSRGSPGQRTWESVNFKRERFVVKVQIQKFACTRPGSAVAPAPGVPIPRRSIAASMRGFPNCQYHALLCQ